MLGSRFDLAGACVLDLFAGTGALGIEALSRGAGRAVFVEPQRGARVVLEHNVEACGFAAAARILALPARRALDLFAREGGRFDGVFLDPPYRSNLLEESLQALVENELLAEPAWIVAEHATAKPPVVKQEALTLLLTRPYGGTAISLLVHALG